MKKINYICIISTMMYDDLDINFDNYSRALACLERYISELSLHFELSDEQLEILVFELFVKIKTPYSFKKMLNMLKLLAR